MAFPALFRLTYFACNLLAGRFRRFSPGLTARPLHWSQPADLFVDVQKLLDQLSEAPAFVNLALLFSQTGQRGKPLADRLAFHLGYQPALGTVAGLTGSMAMTVRIPTGSTCCRPAAILKVNQRIRQLWPP